MAHLHLSCFIQILPFFISPQQTILSFSALTLLVGLCGLFLSSSEMTYHMSGGMLDPTHSLTASDSSTCSSLLNSPSKDHKIVYAFQPFFVVGLAMACTLSVTQTKTLRHCLTIKLQLFVADCCCQEVIMMLNQCTKDFQSLIERLQLLRAYEDADENNRSNGTLFCVIV